MSVKMGPIIETGHHLKHFVASINTDALLTFGADGTVILRGPTAPEKYGENLTHYYQMFCIKEHFHVIFLLYIINIHFINFLISGQRSYLLILFL